MLVVPTTTPSVPKYMSLGECKLNSPSELYFRTEVIGYKDENCNHGDGLVWKQMYDVKDQTLARPITACKPV